MNLTKPVHFWLIVIATAILLILRGNYMLLPPVVKAGDLAIETAARTGYIADLLTHLAYYVVFCLVVLGHAVCSATKQGEAG